MNTELTNALHSTIERLKAELEGASREIAYQVEERRRLEADKDALLKARTVITMDYPSSVELIALFKQDIKRWKSGDWCESCNAPQWVVEGIGHYCMTFPQAMREIIRLEEIVDIARHLIPANEHGIDPEDADHNALCLTCKVHAKTK